MKNQNEQEVMQEFEFDENGRMVPKQKPKVQDKNGEDSEFLRLSEQALVCIMAVLQNGLMTGDDITDELRSLELFPAGINKLFVNNPPHLKLTLDQEQKLKKQWIDRMESGKGDNDDALV